MSAKPLKGKGPWDYKVEKVSGFMWSVSCLPPGRTHRLELHGLNVRRLKRWLVSFMREGRTGEFPRVPAEEVYVPVQAAPPAAE